MFLLLTESETRNNRLVRNPVRGLSHIDQQYDRVVRQILERNVQLGRQQPWIDIYREASNTVYDAIGRPRPGSETDPSTALQAASANVVPIRSDVIERKRAAPRATQAIGLRAPAPVAPRLPSGSELVEQMRRQRGQSPLR